MKKIDRLLLVIFSSFLFCISCSGDEYVTPPVVSEKYVLLTEEVLPLYVRASNRVGGVNIAGRFVKNEELELTLKQLILLNPKIMGFIKQLNYIDFISNQNLVISYRGSNGTEILIPDMLNEDGSLAKGLKYRKTFTTLHLRITEKLTRFLKLPISGELQPIGAFNHITDDKGYLIYLNKNAINYYLEIAKTMNLDWAEITLIREIVAQYASLDDVLKIGIYLKKID